MLFKNAQGGSPQSARAIDSRFKNSMTVTFLCRGNSSSTRRGRCVCITLRLKRLAQEAVALPDEAPRQAEAVGERSVGRAVGRVLVAAPRVEPQRRFVDLVHVKKHLVAAKNKKTRKKHTQYDGGTECRPTNVLKRPVIVGIRVAWLRVASSSWATLLYSFSKRRGF